MHINKNRKNHRQNKGRDQMIKIKLEQRVDLKTLKILPNRLRISIGYKKWQNKLLRNKYLQKKWSKNSRKY